MMIGAVPAVDSTLGPGPVGGGVGGTWEAGVASERTKIDCVIRGWRATIAANLGTWRLATAAAVWIWA